MELPNGLSAMNKTPAPGEPRLAATGMPSTAVVKITFVAPSTWTNSGQVTRGDPGILQLHNTEPSERAICCAMPSTSSAGL